MKWDKELKALTQSILTRGDKMLSLVKTDKPKAKTPKRNPNLHSRTIVVGDIINTKQFESFDGLKRVTNKALAVMRENWLREVLKIHGVQHTKKDLTKREIQEKLSDNKIRIERVVKDGTDMDKVFKDDKLIGEWNNNRKISLDFDGRLRVTIEYYILPSK